MSQKFGGEGAELLDLAHVQLALGDAHRALVQQPLGCLGCLLEALGVFEVGGLELVKAGLELGEALLGGGGGLLGLGHPELAGLGGALGDGEVLEAVVEALLPLGDLGAKTSRVRIPRGLFELLLDVPWGSLETLHFRSYLVTMST